MTIEDDPFGVQSIAVSSIVSSALLASLFAKLAEIGVLDKDDVHDVYDSALHGLEIEQAASDPETEDLYQQAREVIEGPLRQT